MLRAQDRSYTRRDTWLFLSCVVLSVLGMFAPPSWRNGIAAGLRDSVLYPLVWLQERAQVAQASRARLAELVADRDSAAFAAQFVPALRAENARLRELLGLRDRLRASYVPAEVLHQAQVTDRRMLLLDVGQQAGVRPLDPVVAPEGLIGAIWSVGDKTSVAMTWAHPEFRVSAFTADGEAFGLVTPSGASVSGENGLELRGVPFRQSVPDGTLVLSSGLGGVYPKGIPIGTVAGVAREREGWERVYALRPAAHPSVVSHVLVLTPPHDTAVGEAFPTDSILQALAADSARRKAVADSLLRVRIADSVLAAVAERGNGQPRDGGTGARDAASAAPPVRRSPVPPVRRSAGQPGTSP